VGWLVVVLVLTLVIVGFLVHRIVSVVKGMKVENSRVDIGK
jgi:hypothetical protein